MQLQAEHSQVVADLIKPGQKIIDELTPAKANLWHMGTGAAGEAGELLDAIKRHTVYNKEINRENVVEELGDLEFFLEGIRAQLGISREETLEHNLNKLLKGDKARYKAGSFSNEAAIERADKQ